MAVNRPPMASWLDSGVALSTSFLILKGWGSGKFPVRCIVSSLSRRYISFSLFRAFEGCFRIRRAPDKQGIFDALEIMFGACCQLAASELHTIFCGADVLNVPAYEEHRTNRKGVFVSGSRLVRAQFVLPNRFVSFKRLPALESCSAC